MAANIQGITDSNPVELLSDRQLAEETLRLTRENARLLRSLDETMVRLVSAGANGGARGFRQALGQVANGR